MRKILTILLIAIFFAACSDNDDVTTTSNLRLNLNGLETLGANYVYESWVLTNGVPTSTGAFTSVTFPESFTVDSDKLASADAFVLSIEPAVDPDLAPTKIFWESFSRTSASGTYTEFRNATYRYRYQIKEFISIFC